jgi:PAS domain S-box-containing protein
MDLLRKFIEAFPHSFCVIDVKDYTLKMAGPEPLKDAPSDATTCYAFNYNYDKPCSAEGKLCPLEIARKTGKPAVVERSGYDKNGNPGYFEVHAVPILGSDGNISFFIECFLDITQRKSAEEAVIESNRLLETLIDSTHVLIAYLDARFNFIRVNQAYANADEKDKSFFPGKNHFDLYPDEDNKRIFERVRETGEPHFAYAKPFKYAEHPERGVTYWDWSLIPLKDSEAKVIGLILTISDVTKRVRAEQALKQSERRYALAQRAANIGSWDWDIKTGDLYWSDCIEPMFGFKRGEFEATYEAFIRTVHPNDREYVVDSVNACINDGKDYAVEHRIVWPDGTVRWVSEMGDVVRDKNGNAIRMHGAVRDITARKLAEEDLRRVRDELEQRVKERTAELAAINEQLRIEREALERKNIALREILDHINSEKISVKHQIATNIEQAVLPTLVRLKESSNPLQAKSFEMLEKDLKEIGSPFLAVLKTGYERLSSRELEICRYIKNGFSSKDIARVLNTSEQTVLKQRKIIRNKLGISGRPVNLTTYLKSLESIDERK